MLRDDLNYELQNSLNQGQRKAAGRAVARARPDIALNYLDALEDTDLQPYDVVEDPKLLVGWAEAGREAAVANPAAVGQPQSEDEFLAWVKTLAEEFRAAVEDTDLWKVLWNETLTRNREEKIVPAVAGARWVQQCKAANVDISNEPNMGRGPVDFKFSAGWTKRARPPSRPRPHHRGGLLPHEREVLRVPG
ncbi:hypothetical protein [Nocardioides lijunqiniae]|uniref:hypothetical protein n=1 Tax=Nocardioides lijunqiniae TaxID=2760832 RepID=UPI0018785061|nr:hypothetical protein [Nocardioides lijunqiniae]